MIYLLFFLGISLNAAATYFFKVLATSTDNLISFTTLKNPIFYVALGLFAGNIAFYGLLLQKLNLSVAYPAFIGGTFVIVMLISFFFLREHLNLVQITGIALIFIGILLATR